MTAIGIEAETVSPALSARYTVAAPKSIAGEGARDDRLERELAHRGLVGDVRLEVLRRRGGELGHAGFLDTFSGCAR